MHTGCERPIIFPLSNPSRQVEAHPKDVIEWTKGQAIVATGSPFDPVEFNGETFTIPQCNNSYIFPGIGLGVLAAKASRITESMLMIASEMLAESSPWANTGKGSLLPSLVEIEPLSKRIAFAVAKKRWKRAWRWKCRKTSFGLQLRKTTGCLSTVTTNVVVFKPAI
ncbi:hypothetical protein AC626_08420 [Pseudoalteromonas rubra]|uniref:Malic enzyme NAD-binding domain-containing protein n=1 Tax=Pseudoalteromonas rubra TaxID=43658 RepID=A0A0L0ETV5_9GAMM|nr:hypothetical protein AC626_08420 [Pseudoalteromonas rubra]